MPEVLGVDERVQGMTMAQTRMMKDLSCLDLPRRPFAPATIPPPPYEGPSIPIETIDIYGGSVELV